MKKDLLVGVAFAALAISPSFAADLAARPYTKAPILEPAPTWTGFYLGGQLGGGWNTNSWTNLTSPSAFEFNLPAGNGNANGLLGGFQAGFNYQIGQKVVVGIEGEYDFADIKGDTFLNGQFTGFGGLSGLANTHQRYIAAVTGRIGALYHDDILLYVKGGWAWSQFRYDVSVFAGEGAPGVYPTVTDNRDGFTVGFGAEYKLDRNWSAKIEYDYYDFRKTNVAFPQGSTNLPTPPFTADISQQTHVAKVGINYTFGWVH